MEASWKRLTRKTRHSGASDHDAARLIGAGGCSAKAQMRRSLAGLLLEDGYAHACMNLEGDLENTLLAQCVNGFHVVV